MIAKRNLGRGKVRVTFTMPPTEAVKQLCLVGDFNNWSINETPLTQAADGGWTASVTLAAGQDYQFRYLANGREWHNDWAADAYQPNEYGTENSVVSLIETAKPAAKKSSRSKKLI